MAGTESLREYYLRTNKVEVIQSEQDIDHSPHFNIFSRYNCYCSLQYRRIDYYKIMLTHGEGRLITADQEIQIKQPTLIFLDNSFEFGWETVPEVSQDGFTCLFNSFFITPGLRLLFHKLMDKFKKESAPVLTLTEQRYQQLKVYFQSLAIEHQEQSPYKRELLGNLLMLIVTNGLKWLDAQRTEGLSGAGPVLYNAFMELLEQQFPIDNPIESKILRKPGLFASALHVHVNHLNMIVKQHTGKTTSAIIQERIMIEATNLLRYSNWQIAEISYALGFPYPQHFSNLFRNHFDQSPVMYRKSYQWSSAVG